VIYGKFFVARPSLWVGDMKSLVLPIVASAILAAACSAGDPSVTTSAPTPGADVVAPMSGGSKTTPVCWNGVTLPRPAAGPTPLPSVSAAFAAYTTALAGYQTAAAAFSIASAEHAAAYNAVANVWVGQPCTSSADCNTGSAAFPGVCTPLYYSHAQCNVTDAFPLAGPQPPPAPVFTCADFSCASNTNYTCALEANTGTLACVLSRCSTGGGATGGGGGGTGGGGTGGGKVL
jgi:hypothetical protein